MSSQSAALSVGSVIAHWASGSLACLQNHRSFHWVNWDHSVELAQFYKSVTAVVSLGLLRLQNIPLLLIEVTQLSYS